MSATNNLINIINTMSLLSYFSFVLVIPVGHMTEGQFGIEPRTLRPAVEYFNHYTIKTPWTTQREISCSVCVCELYNMAS